MLKVKSLSFEHFKKTYINNLFNFNIITVGISVHTQELLFELIHLSSSIYILY